MERNLLLLILLVSQFFGSNTFWFSYKSVASNNILIYEQKNIAPLVIPYVGKISSTCKVRISRETGKSDLKKLNDNFDNILPCFYGMKTIVTSQSIVGTKGIRDRVEVVIEPVRFIVDFKDDFANISILK